MQLICPFLFHLYIMKNSVDISIIADAQTNKTDQWQLVEPLYY